ncbi:hypothetical protein BH10BAC6_BH10BAC6_14420 [soil metagenome]
MNQSYSPISRKLIRGVLYIGGGTLAVVVIGTLLAYILLSDDIQERIQKSLTVYLQERANTEAKQLGSKNKVEIGAVRYSFFTNNLSIEGVHVLYHDSTLNKGLIVDVRIPEARCSGVAWYDVMFGDGLSLGDISFERPTVLRTHWDLHPDTTQAALDTSQFALPKFPNVDTLIQRAMYGFLPTNVRPLKIKSIRMAHGTLINNEKGPANSYVGRYKDMSFDVTGIAMGVVGVRPIATLRVSIGLLGRLDSDSSVVEISHPHLDVTQTDSSFTIDTIRYSDPHGMKVESRNVLFSYRDHLIKVDTFMIGATGTDDAYFVRNGRSDRIKADCGKIRLSGIDITELTNGTALNARSCVVTHCNLDVLSNSRPPKKKGPKPLQLNDLAQMVPFKLHVDTVRVANATIKYGELHLHSATAGRLWWDGIRFQALNVDPLKTLVIDASGRFFATARMQAHFEFDLASKVYRMQSSGSLGSIDPTLLNSFLPYTDDLRITRGHVDEASYSFSVNGNKANGSVSIVYSKLKVAMLNEKSKKSGFFDSITSWIANAFVIRGDNERGDENFKRGKIKYTMRSDAAVMQTIWFPIRAGLGDVIGF